MAQYYTSSGKVGPMAFVYWILAALIALPILALIYAYAIWYIPIPYINFIITAGFGMLIGVAIAFLVISLGKVRNKMWATIFVLFGALTALYIHWAVWVDLVINISGTVGGDRIGIATSNIKMGQVINLILQPGTLFELMKEINAVGVWGIKGGTVSGGFLTFIWVVELLLATIVALAVGVGQASKPFCEHENKWFDETDLAPAGHIGDSMAFEKALASGDMDQLNEMIKPAGNIKEEHHAKITIYDAASGENFVTVENEIAKKDSKGEISFNTESVTRYLKVNQEVMDRLRAIT